ncbi:MAG: tRNA (adenosine(37)-N6)-threonylcarbamoyltransferase complex transferase subunit TsaD [Clostridia bacterium]|nr:tRNA (adenosine(37)-N6)-threonylcarbamoyltransferase complex transferase subunit TsaD [Clostridia bacterium]
MLILGIESSCDETAAAVVEDGRRVHSNVIASQLDVHQLFGGVVPEIASRKHLEFISPVVAQAMQEAKVAFSELEAVAVTYGPGLVGALLVGLSAAKGLAYSLGIPLIGVNHIRGHLYAGFLQFPDLEPPLVVLIASGGHTTLAYLENHGSIKILGRSRDDAAGEALDKVARALGLGYPGGPQIESLARDGDPHAFDFPRAWLGEGSLDFSFSGLKTAVIRQLMSLPKTEKRLADLAASFQEAVFEVLVTKSIRAAQQYQAKTILVAGGVASNQALRQKLVAEGGKQGIQVLAPDPIYCTDNAAMIACAGYYQLLAGDQAPLNLNAVPNLDAASGFCGQLPGDGCG